MFLTSQEIFVQDSKLLFIFLADLLFQVAETARIVALLHTYY